MTDPRAELERRWGYAAFRPLQREAVDAALTGRDALVVLPTGGGKSVCYQLPAACGRALTVVVSPLIALMDDQVLGAREAGLRAAALHSNLREDQKRAARDALSVGQLDLLYLSPERLQLGDLAALLARQCKLLAVDEAHCISHWGHDFRPEYRQLGALAQQLHAPRLALTATATPQVQDDIVAQLGLRDPLRLVGHIDRPNLIFRVAMRQSQPKQVLAAVQRNAGQGAIVYAQTRKEVERLAAHLQAAKVSCLPYHAGLPAAARTKAQDDFVNERVDVVVATIAFGMGIDRSNVRLVVHANAPKSIEHYQQEAGRAGRDGEPAECLLLFSGSDLVTHRYLANLDGPLPPDRARVLERSLREIGRYAVAPVCRHRLLTEHFGQDYTTDGCGACDVCLGETAELPAAEALVTAQKILSAVWRFERSYGPGHCCDVLTGTMSDAVRQRGHDQLTVWGLLRDAGAASVRAWIDQLVIQGHLDLVEHDRFQLLELTPAGRALCKGQGTVRLGVARAASPSTPRERKAKAKTTLPDGDAALFERLRTLRRRIAERLGAPPYVVFPDSTLVALAAVKPAAVTALRGVKGVGEHKLRHYGAAVVAVVSGEDPDAVADAWTPP